MIRRNGIFDEGYEFEEKGVELVKPEELYNFWVSKQNPDFKMNSELEEKDHSKFHTICSLRFIQMLHRNDLTYI